MNDEVNFIIINTGTKYVKANKICIRNFDSHNDEGEPCVMKGVQYNVIGNNRQWTDWMPYEKFKVANPEIEIP